MILPFWCMMWGGWAGCGATWSDRPKIQYWIYYIRKFSIGYTILKKLNIGNTVLEKFNIGYASITFSKLLLSFNQFLHKRTSGERSRHHPVCILITMVLRIFSSFCIFSVYFFKLFFESSLIIWGSSCDHFCITLGSCLDHLVTIWG